MNICERKISSVDRKNELYTKIYLPEGEAKGIFHIVHGMTEHIERYSLFMEFLAQNGYIAFGYDHLGHGKTAKKGDHGFISDKDGWDLLCRDVKNVSDVIRSEYGESLPYYLLGHSMGSFIVRVAVSKYVCPDKLIVMGTGGKNPAAPMGIALAKFISAIFGKRHISRLVLVLAFGGYNKKFKKEKDSKAWLTKDRETRRRYKNDEMCMFHFTSSAMRDLITLNLVSNKPETFKSTKKSLHVLILSGMDDPVGSYGKDVEFVCSAYKNEGIDAKMKLYQNCRHEILNDDCKEMVYADIIDFLND